MRWFNRKKSVDLIPDVDQFNRDLIKSVNVENYDGQQVAADFRRLFLKDPDLGKRVLFILMKWCGEYENNIPTSTDELNRWAGKKEIAWNIKAALNANLDNPKG